MDFSQLPVLGRSGYAQQQPVAGGRPGQIGVEVCIYDRNRHIGKEPKPYADIIRAARSRPLEVSIKDDDGKDIAGRTDPSTVRVDGNQVFAMVHAALKPEHKVEKLFGVPDLTPEQLAANEEVDRVFSDDIFTMNEMAGLGATDEQLYAFAEKESIRRPAAEKLVRAIRAIRERASENPDDSVAAVVAACGGVPVPPVLPEGPAEQPGSEVAGGGRVDARISGSADLHLSPGGSVG